MNSPGTKYKNLKNDNRNSLIEIKEKMRKNYKNKVQNCREILMNRFRGVLKGEDLRNTLNEIYKNIFDFTNSPQTDEEEMIVFEQVKNELMQEEFDWCLAEYEKSQTDIDWSSIENEDNVICPICQKNNLTLCNNILTCSYCNSSIQTDKTLDDIKKSIMHSLEKHSSECNGEFEFSIVPELNETHIYLICSKCSEMQIIV